jgi:hypothetical protein
VDSPQHVVDIVIVDIGIDKKVVSTLSISISPTDMHPTLRPYRVLLDGVDAEEDGVDPRRCGSYPLPTCDVREKKAGVTKRGLADEVGITMMYNFETREGTNLRITQQIARKLGQTKLWRASRDYVFQSY